MVFSSAGWCSIDSSAAAEALAAINQVSGHNISMGCFVGFACWLNDNCLFLDITSSMPMREICLIATFIVYAIIVRLKVTGVCQNWS